MARARDDGLRAEIRAALSWHPAAELRAAAARAGVVNRRGLAFAEWYGDDAALARALAEGDAELPFMGLPLLGELDRPRALALARAVLSRDNQDMMQAGAAWVLPDGELLERIEQALPEARALYAETPPRAPVLDLFHLIQELGRRRCQAAVPLLIGLWQAGFQGAAAGHALLQIATPEALAALADQVAERPPVLASAVRAVFAQGPARAFDRLAPLLGEAALAEPFRRGQASQLLHLLWTDASPDARPSSPGQGWLLGDPRWLDLVLGLILDRHGWREPGLVDLARRLTACFAPAEVAAARARRRPAPRRRARVKPAAAQAARATMRAADAALRELVARLRAADYRFQREPITPVAPDQVAALVAKLGALPAALAAFWEVVGAVNLTGRHPELTPAGEVATDPLVVFGPEVALVEVDDWLSEHASIAPELRPAYPIPIAPEALSKIGYSGGPPYAVRALAAADGAVEHAPRPRRFTAYLRDAVLRWGGFPGFATVKPRPRLLAQLTAGLPRF